MSVFVDTGVSYAHPDRDAPRHDDATAALERAISGRWGHLFTSDYVVAETVALTRSRTGSYADSKSVADRILGGEQFASAVELMFGCEDNFYRALDVFGAYFDHSLSFTDATTVALVDAHGIDSLRSLESDFDGIVDRLGPGEVATGSS